MQEARGRLGFGDFAIGGHVPNLEIGGVKFAEILGIVGVRAWSADKSEQSKMSSHWKTGRRRDSEDICRDRSPISCNGRLLQRVPKRRRGKQKEVVVECSVNSERRID